MKAKGKRRRWVVIASAIALVILLVMLREPLLRALGVRAKAPAELTVFLTADTRGHLEPCGCRSDQSGGLPVRSTLLRQDTARTRLLIDAGNITYGNREYDRLKFGYILNAMAAMHYDAVNLGATDVTLTRDELLGIVKAHRSLDFVSCNVLDARSRQPLVQPFVIRRFGRYRVGITGVTGDQLEAVGEGLMVVPPLEALGQWVPRLARRCDYLIVAAFVDRPTMEEIARKFYEVDAVFGGDVAQSSGYAETVNRAAVFAVTDEGKVMGRLTLKRSAAGGLSVVASRGLAVKDSLPTDPKIVAVVDAFKGELRQRRIEFAESGEHLDPIAPPPRSAEADRYLGAEGCKECHPESYAAWQKSGHARSLASLRPRNNQYDPECLPCHVQGYGASDGYVSEEQTPQMASVQCESCHGRGAEHAAAYRRGESPLVSSLRAVTPNTCIKCHDEENSANFSYARFWPKVRHAEPKLHARAGRGGSS